MMKNNKINVGVIGAGKIVSWFLNDVKLSKYADDINVSGIFNRTYSKAENYAKEYGIDKAYETFEEFLKGDYDFVYIGTTDLVHVDYSMKLLNAGFNVYCEKPITWTYDEAKKVYDLAKEKQRIFFDGIKTGFSPAYKKAKEEINKGTIGEIILLHSTHTKVSTSLNKPNPKPEDKGSGFHLGGGVYSAFTIIDLLGYPESYDFKTNTYPHNKAISTSAILSRHKNGAISTMVGSDYTTDNLTTVIQGSKGYITLGGRLDKYNKSYKKDSTHMAHTLEIRDLANNLINKYDFPFETEGEGLVFEIDHFYEMIRDGKLSSDIVTPEISLNIMKLLENTNKKNL